MKNKTRFKRLNVVNTDGAVAEVYQDVDGIWLCLTPGWTCDPLSAHDGHADTVREILALYRGIRMCQCDECAAYWRAHTNANTTRP